jgi:hypothetical protein
LIVRCLPAAVSRRPISTKNQRISTDFSRVTEAFVSAQTLYLVSTAFLFVEEVVAAVCLSRNSVWCWAADYSTNRFESCLHDPISGVG